MKANAILDDSRQYRYKLERTWDCQNERVLFVMLNPSTADEKTDDHTIRRCRNLAKSWGYGGLVVGNLFALRSKDPRALLRHPNPVGPDNDAYLQQLADECEVVVAAWGTWGEKFPQRQAFVKALLKGRMQCLEVNLDGTPLHPLTAKASATLKSYE